ncbi:pyridoxamine 5'-phosphate oxidase family protein [Xinfangfangia pollutisoli]|uniref:pyridoxamine 5'-phosphate oxidase family protein n=1 Tax=Xinfangfangia pollutisoli TaxID=2865960 RepID=UPI001CD289E1|nr:pyridoxamine 5'-phosphate oxidase family protein [Xinfangfangia pollutisoli]
MTKAPTDRTRLRRMHEKGAHDPALIAALVDALPLAHIGHLVEGMPMVTPTLIWRMGRRVLWHGSSASRMVRAALAAPVCLTASGLDAMVLARSGLEHSVNYRSVMVMGQPQALRDPTEKEDALRAMMEHLFPGRWQALRPMTAQELKATAVLALPLDEASAKIDASGPADPAEDLDWPVWAGTLPLLRATGTPQPAPGLAAALAADPPAYLSAFRFG